MYILEMSTVLDMSFCLHPLKRLGIAYLFIPLTMPFAEHKILVLMRSSFINFFMGHTFCVMSKNSSPSLENFLLCVLQKVSQFYTLHLNL